MSEQELHPHPGPRWTLGELIRKARKNADMTQIELHLATGIARSTIANYEADLTPLPKRAFIEMIARATGADWLVDEYYRSYPELLTSVTRRESAGYEQLSLIDLTDDSRWLALLEPAA